MSITLRNIKGSPLTHDEMDDNFSALTGSLGAGNGLTGGGFLTTGVEFNVGQGDGISVSADGVAVNDTVARTGSNAFTGPQNIQSSITASSALLGGFTYPTTDSSYGFVLATDGAGNLFFQQATSGSITSSGAVFPFTGSAGILGSLNVDGTISATTSVTVNDYTLPLADGALGSLVTTDGSGTLSFGTVDSLITFDNVEINVKAGEAITKGDPVYISGTVGASERAIVSKADASNSAKMPAIGLAQEDMSTNDLGKVTLSGFLRNITTDPIDGITPSSNDTVYVKAGGGLTLTKPSGSNLIQNIAKVGKVSGGNAGTLIVSAILRTNDVPNLLTGEVFYGVGDKAVHKPLSDILSGSEFTYSGSFSGSFVGPSINVTSGSFTRLDATTGNVVTLTGTTSTFTSGSFTRLDGTTGNVTTLTGTTSTFTSASLNRLDVTGNSALDGDLTVTGRVTAEEFHTEFVSASIIYQSGSTKFGDTSDDRHSFTGSVEILGSLTGSSNIDIAGTVDANVYSINGTTVVDSSRNITGSAGTFSGNVDVASLDSTGNVDANSYSINDTTVIDSSQNITGASLDVTGEVEGNSVAIDGTTVIDASRNITGTSLDVTGEVEGNSFAINTSTVIDSSQNITGASLDVTGNADANTFSIDGSTVIDASENITGTSLDVTGEVEGNIISINGSTVIDSSQNITGASLDVTGEVEGNSFAVNNDTVITSGRVINNITQANVDNLRLDGNTLSNTATDQNVIIDAIGTGILDVNVGSNFQDLVTVQGDIFPEINYTSNIGAINKKFLSLNVAELIVETLVASERRSTVGGRFNVGIGTQLSQSISPSSTSILVENNNLNSGDIIHLETGGNVEFMKVTSAASSGSGDGFSYNVTRNLDGTGANSFDAGAGIFNTGQIGNGFIDQYAINSLTTGVNTAGPAIAFMERTGSAFPDIDVRTAVGNLKGWYGYSNSIFGFAAGNYKEQNITVDPTNGLRIRNVNTLQLQASGSTLTIGDNFIFNSSTGLLKVSGSNIQLESPTFFLGGNSQFISGSNGNLRIESTNFTLSQNGDVSMTGTVTAEAGQIGGFAITDSAITGSGFFLSGSATGNQFFISASNFNVKANGDITASNADISGNIVAQSGTIGGFNIATDLTAGSGLLTLKGSSGQITGSNVLFTGGKISGSAIAFDVTNFVAKGDTVEISGSNFHLLNGNITASNVDLSGNINAQTGTIGGFNITADALSSSNFFLSGSATGNEFFISSSKFNVKANGDVTASNATITGDITATNITAINQGNIAGFTLSSDQLVDSNTGTSLVLKSNGQITGSNVLFTGGKISGSAVEFDVTNFVAKGDTVEISGSNFHLLNGDITASNATISGDITATNITAVNQGNIAGFTLTSNQLSDSGNNLVLKSSGQITGSNVLFTGGKISGSAIEFDVTEFVAKGDNVEISGSSFHLLNGNITASNVDLSGEINAESGTIGGFNIGNGVLNSGNSFFISGSATGNNYFISSSKFHVTAGGDVTAEDASFTGTSEADAFAFELLKIDSSNQSDYIKATTDGYYVLDLSGGTPGTAQFVRFESSVTPNPVTFTHIVPPKLAGDSKGFRVILEGTSDNKIKLRKPTGGATLSSSTLNHNGSNSVSGIFDIGHDGDDSFVFTNSEYSIQGGERVDLVKSANDYKIQSTNKIQDLRVNGSLTVDGSAVLTSANAGSGNSLDSDTVDGLEASQFLRSDVDDSTSGALTINGTLLKSTSSVSVNNTTANILTTTLANFDAVFFDYVIKNGSNLRAGTVYAVHDGSNVEFTETSTQDLGDTSDVTLSVDILINLRFRATTTSSGWTIKAFARGL